MLLYRAAVDLSRATLNYLAGVIRRHRTTIGSPWRLLNPGRQASWSWSTCAKAKRSPNSAPDTRGRPARPGGTSRRPWRLLLARSPKLTAALRTATRNGVHLLVLDGTLIACDRVRANPVLLGQTPLPRHERTGRIAGPDGTILWTSGAMPGSTHDLIAARVWGILRELDKAGILTPADRGPTTVRGRKGLAAIISIATTGCSWQHLPRAFRSVRSHRASPLYRVERGVGLDQAAPPGDDRGQASARALQPSGGSVLVHAGTLGYRTSNRR